LIKVEFCYWLHTALITFEINDKIDSRHFFFFYKYNEREIKRKERAQGPVRRQGKHETRPRQNKRQ